MRVRSHSTCSTCSAAAFTQERSGTGSGRPQSWTNPESAGEPKLLSQALARPVSSLSEDRRHSGGGHREAADPPVGQPPPAPFGGRRRRDSISELAGEADPEKPLRASGIVARGLAALGIQHDGVGRRPEPDHAPTRGEIPPQETFLGRAGDRLGGKPIRGHHDRRLPRALRLAQQAKEARRIENLVALSREVIARRRVAIEPLPRARLRPEDGAAGALAARRGPVSSAQSLPSSLPTRTVAPETMGEETIIAPVANRQRSAPVLASSAKRWPSSQPKNTVPPATAPEEKTRSVVGKRQISWPLSARTALKNFPSELPTRTSSGKGGGGADDPSDLGRAGQRSRPCGQSASAGSRSRARCRRGARRASRRRRRPR